MNTDNLQLHQWIIKMYPEIAADYIYYDDDYTFKPIKLSCAVEYLSTLDSEHGKLKDIVRYWTPYRNR